MTLTIDTARQGKTIKEILLRDLRLSGRTISYLKNIPDGITVNGEHKTVRYTLCRGDILSLALEDRDSSRGVEPISGELEALYEDESVLVLNKPPFLPVHPAKKNRFDSLAARTGAYFDRPFVFRAVNRLDRDTSGVVLVALDRVSAQILAAQMFAHSMEKEYLAVVSGRMPENSSGVIDFNICRPDINSSLRKAVEKGENAGENTPFGSVAVTGYTVLAVSESASLVRVFPKTGRTHQIRVHFAAIGHPIVGDLLYGEPSTIIGRQALHAFRLSFFHPVSKERKTVTAPLPKDMRELLASLGIPENVI